ncbi:MAG TPA: hypothetical protein VH637_03695 [Streptosporangiaceae bacterium]
MVLAVLALAACNSGGQRSAAHQTAAQRRAAVDHFLAGTKTAGARHNARALRAALTPGLPALKIEETCLGGGMLKATVRFPGRKPVPFTGTCGGPPARSPLVAGVSFSPRHPRAEVATVIVQPAKGQDYWIGIGAGRSS